MRSSHLKRLFHKESIAGGINLENEQEVGSDATNSHKTQEKEDNNIISPLSDSKDPRVKKLKKELEKLNVAPKTKYININFKK